MACLEWLAMAEVNSLTGLFSPTLCYNRLRWIRHDSFSKRHEGRKKKNQNLANNEQKG
jgi:hypothetical protein